MAQSQGSSSGQVVFCSSIRAKTASRRVAAARAWLLHETVSGPSLEADHVRGLDDDELQKSGLDRGADRSALGEPLLGLLGRHALAELNQCELSDLPTKSALSGSSGTVNPRSDMKEERAALPNHPVSCCDG